MRPRSSMQDSGAPWRVFDETATDWGRSCPVVLTDFTARPLLLEWCEPVAGSRVLELGCGEGYTARQLAARGAGHVVGIDRSGAMIRRARAADEDASWGIEYRCQDVTDLTGFDTGSFDLVLADFLFDCLSIDDTRYVIDEIRRLLRPGGRLVFVVTHPMLPFVRRAEPPLYCEGAAQGYFSGRDRRFDGRVWRRDGVALPLVYCHKTLEDYVAALRRAGYVGLPEMRELGVRQEHVALDPTFFEPLVETPLHIAMRVHTSDRG